MEKLWLAPVSPGDTVLVGLSGGADSVALTHMLRFNRPEYHLKVSACHINHHLRGDESDRDMQFVQALCREWEIPLFVLEEQVAKLAAQTGESLETCGRRVRYRFFEEIAAQLDSETGRTGRVWIATAHTLSDQAETMLFNLARGAGLRGLCGIPARRGDILRPLLGVTRIEIEQYCEGQGLAYVTDSTNCCTDYARNKIRQKVIPVLKEVNSGLEQHLEKTASSLTEDLDFLETAAQAAYEAADSGNGLAGAQLRLLHPAVRKRVLILWLKDYRLTVSHKLVEAADGLVFKNHGKINLETDKYLCMTQGILNLTVVEKPQEYYEFPLTDGIYQSKTGKNYKIKTLSIGTSQSFHKIYKNLFDILIDCGKICGSITIRQRKDGDRIKLISKQHTKSLKKLFQESGVGVSERSRRFVLADAAGVIAVEGFGIDQRVCCDENTTEMLRLEERI